MQGLVRIARDEAQLFLLALQDETRHCLSGNLLPGMIGQTTHPYECETTSARLRSFLVGYGITGLLSAVDIADQGRFDHRRMPGRKASRRGTAHRMTADIGLRDPEVLQQGVHIRDEMLQRVVLLAGWRR